MIKVTLTNLSKIGYQRYAIYCRVGVYKKNRWVNIQDSEFELEDFSQNADPVLLHNYLNRCIPFLNTALFFPSYCPTLSNANNSAIILLLLSSKT